MNDISLHQVLTIYVWFGVTALVFLLALVARFYERLSGQRTYYQFFGLPVIALAGATIRLVSINQVTGDGWGDGLLLISGLSLAALCLHVYRRMTSGH